MPDAGRRTFLRIFAACALVLACGGTSKHSDNDPAAEAGMSGSGAVGGTAGTGGTTVGGASGSGGSAAGGSGGSPVGGSGGSFAGGGNGGTSAGGGGRAGGGSGGEAGVGLCSMFEPCSLEGEVCTLPEECPACTLTCINGQWDAINCTEPFECGGSRPVPANGDPCCRDLGGSCEWEPGADGVVMVGRCIDGTWLIEPKGEMPMCCTSDSQCAPNVCANGSCLPRVEGSGSCWRDDDCGRGELCSAALVCGCDVVCGGPNRPGTCVPDDMDCCRDDADCEAGQLCASGICRDRSPEGCWRSDECPMLGQVCWTVNACPCGMTCETPDAPGECVTPL